MSIIYYPHMYIDPLQLMQLENRIRQIEVNQQNILQRLSELESFKYQPATPHNFPYSPFLTHSQPAMTVNSQQPTTPTQATPTHPFHQVDEHQLAAAMVVATKIEGTNLATALPSHEIQKHKLRSVEDVLLQYKKLTTDVAKAGSLATKLAREAVFGVYVMKLCTPLGSRELPGLPVAELQHLRQTVLQQYPQFWQDATLFDPIWKKCQCSIEQACKHLRRTIS